ncbi:MAG: hypothetical protein ACM3ZQ_11875 [Bacillota bacterium]
MSDQISIVGIIVSHRCKNGLHVQERLSHHCDTILCRQGVTDPNSSDGIITVIMHGDDDKVMNLVKDLSGINGVRVAYSQFKN